MQQNAFSWDDGANVLDAFFGNIAGNLNANTTDAAATANINSAIAENIRSSARAREERTKGILNILAIALVGIIVITLASKFFK